MHYYKVERDLGVRLKVKVGDDAIRQGTYKCLTRFARGTIPLKYVTTRTCRKNRSNGSTQVSTTSTRRRDIYSTQELFQNSSGRRRTIVRKH